MSKPGRGVSNLLRRMTGLPEKPQKQKQPPTSFQSLAREAAAHRHAYKEPQHDTNIPAPPQLPPTQLPDLEHDQQYEDDEGFLTVDEYNCDTSPPLRRRQHRSDTNSPDLFRDNSPEPDVRPKTTRRNFQYPEAINHPSRSSHLFGVDEYNCETSPSSRRRQHRSNNNSPDLFRDNSSEPDVRPRTTRRNFQYPEAINHPSRSRSSHSLCEEEPEHQSGRKRQSILKHRSEGDEYSHILAQPSKRRDYYGTQLHECLSDNSEDEWLPLNPSKRRSSQPDERRQPSPDMELFPQSQHYLSSQEDDRCLARKEKTYRPKFSLEDDSRQGKRNMDYKSKPITPITPASVRQIIAVTNKLPDIEKWANSPLDELTWNEFKENFTMHSRALSIPEESWPKILALYLKDGAKIIYTKIINKYPNLNEDFYGLIQEMDQEFTNSGGVVPSFDLNSRKKLDTESVGKFYSTICAMAKRAYPNIDEHARDQIILAQFIKGLPFTFQRGILNNSLITSSDEAFKVAQRYEHTNQLLLQDVVNQTTINTIENDKKDQEIESLKRSLKALELREKEKADYANEVARHRWRDDNMRRNPLGPNRDFYSHKDSSRFRRQHNSREPDPDTWQRFQSYYRGPDTTWQRNRRDNFQRNTSGTQRYMPAQHQSYRVQQPSYRFQGSPARFQQRGRFQAPARFQPFRNRFHRPQQHQNRFQQAHQYNQQHNEEELDMDGRPVCTNCGQRGHHHYTCRSRRGQPNEPRDRVVRFIDEHNLYTRNTPSNSTTVHDMPTITSIVKPDTPILKDAQSPRTSPVMVTPISWEKTKKTITTEDPPKRKLISDTGTNQENLRHLSSKPDNERQQTKGGGNTLTFSNWIPFVIALTMIIPICLAKVQGYPDKPMLCSPANSRRFQPALMLNLPENINYPNLGNSTEKITPMTVQLCQSQTLRLQEKAFLCSQRETTIQMHFYFLGDDRLNKIQGLRFELKDNFYITQQHMQYNIFI